ncbi:TPA: hypothetical protein ACKRDG_000203 [Proteus mirabilis]
MNLHSLLYGIHRDHSMGNQFDQHHEMLTLVLTHDLDWYMFPHHPHSIQGIS